MFHLPSGPATHSEGQDREHPIVLEGYKKYEFACLLKVMYPRYVHVMFIYTLIFFYLWTFDRARSIISGTNLEFPLDKEGWISVLKLSTIWDMTEVCRTQSLRLSAEPTDIDQIRQYAIHWLSTNVTLSPIEKILLARAHRVGAWLEEGVNSLVTCNPMPALEDLATLGCETVARILWIRDNFPPEYASC